MESPCWTCGCRPPIHSREEYSQVKEHGRSSPRNKENYIYLPPYGICGWLPGCCPTQKYHGPTFLFSHGTGQPLRKSSLVDPLSEHVQNPIAGFAAQPSPARVPAARLRFFYPSRPPAAIPPLSASCRPHSSRASRFGCQAHCWACCCVPFVFALFSSSPSFPPLAFHSFHRAWGSIRAAQHPVSAGHHRLTGAADR